MPTPIPLVVTYDSNSKAVGFTESIHVSATTVSALNVSSQNALSAAGEQIPTLNSITVSIPIAGVEGEVLTGAGSKSFNQAQAIALFTLKDGHAIQSGRIRLSSTSGVHEFFGGVSAHGDSTVSGDINASGNINTSGNTVTKGNSTVNGNITTHGDVYVSGDVGIGVNSPVATAALEVVSTTKSFLPPRMTTSQRNAISSPATGSVIYNSTTNLLNHYNGSAWLAVGAVAAGASETKAFYDALGGTQTVTILNGLITSWITS